MLLQRLCGWILPTRWVPLRAIIALMMFTCCWTSYVCRLQMNILAVPMIEVTDEISTVGKNVCVQEDQDLKKDNVALVSNDTEPRHVFDLFSGKKYPWNHHIRGQLIAAYSYGNCPGNFLGGVMAQKFGPRLTVLWSSIVAVLLCLTSPLISNVHWIGLFIFRIIVGVTGGISFPACHTMLSKWSPPDERSRFVWSLLGGTFGTIFTYPMVSAISEHMSWEMAWYIPSLLMIVWIFFWFLLAYDSPAEHPGISEEEKNYIIASQSGMVRGERASLKDTPIKQIFTSIPFLSLLICHFGNIFLIFFYQSSMTIYMSKALGYKLTKGGVLSSLPWAGRILFGFFFSWAADIIKRREVMTMTALRKTATICSHFIPGVCLIIVGYLGCSFTLVNVFLVLALGFNGAASIANLSNNQDLSPNYAGFLYGVMNTLGVTSGMIISPMVEAIAGEYGHPIDKWQIIFWIGGGVCIFSMIVFLIGGSAKIQPWNELKPKSNA